MRKMQLSIVRGGYLRRQKTGRRPLRHRPVERRVLGAIALLPRGDAETGHHCSAAGTEKEAIERFWRNIFGGAASTRFHRPALRVVEPKWDQFDGTSWWGPQRILTLAPANHRSYIALVRVI
jgi:hypothetical protein